MTANGVPTESDVAGPAAREFFTTRTVAEARAGFRPGRRTPAETVPLPDALHPVPAAAVVAPAGRPLRAQDLGMRAAAGVTSVSVHTRPRVTVFSTGDEVVPPGTGVLRPGQVRDASAVALAALVAEAGGEPVMGGIVPDDP